MTPFPTSPSDGDYFLREDGFIYRYEAKKVNWVKLKRPIDYLEESNMISLPYSQQGNPEQMIIMKDKTEYQTDQETADLARLVKLCGDLRDRLEAHGFNVVKFAVRVAPELLTCFEHIRVVIGIETMIIWDFGLPPGTIKVSALVQ